MNKSTLTSFFFLLFLSSVSGQWFNSNGVSQIAWPFAGNPHDNSQSWYMSCGSNCGAHNGDDTHAQDWLRSSGSSCNCSFYAPISGTVVWSSLNTNGTYKPLLQGYGYAVAIRSNINPSFVFYVAHLQTIEPGIVNGATVSTRQKIARTGKTGSGSNNVCHPHMVLYKNAQQWMINSLWDYGYFPGDATNAAPFNLSTTNFQSSYSYCSNGPKAQLYFGVYSGSGWYVDLTSSKSFSWFWNKSLGANASTANTGDAGWSCWTGGCPHSTPKLTNGTTYYWRLWTGNTHYYANSFNTPWCLRDGEGDIETYKMVNTDATDVMAEHENENISERDEQLFSFDYEGGNLTGVQIIPNPSIEGHIPSINYILLEPTSTTLEILDMRGQQVDFSHTEMESPGIISKPVVTKQLPVGMYFYRIRAGNESFSGKFIVQ